METIITKTVKGSTMEKIFNKSKVINVKHYEALNVSDANYNPNKKYQFEIRIRHAEDTDANTLFQSEIELFEKKPKTLPEYTIKITGQGTEKQIIDTLSKMVKTMKSKKARKELDAPQFQDLDGCGWNDLTLETFIEIIK